VGPPVKSSSCEISWLLFCFSSVLSACFFWNGLSAILLLLSEQM